jgi:NAD(P)-dependent dehydrogenase (short-subunit alcohol dehydrogenase family)
MFRSHRFNLQGKIVLITGAGSGIGAACARLFHAQGASVVLVDMVPNGITALVGELGELRTLARVASVTDRRQLDQIVHDTVARFGRIDVVFANAGIACDPPATVLKMNEATFERIIEVDLLGVWRTVRACLPSIIESRGHILLTSSIYAYVNGMVNAPYAMSKAGVEMFGRSLRAELAGTGATAGVLYPGWVSTPISRSAMGGHAVASALVRLAYPGPFKTPITAEVVAAATLKGIQKRAARIMVPSRWIPIALLRGIFNPISDWIIDRHRGIQTLVRELEQQEVRKDSD